MKKVDVKDLSNLIRWNNKRFFFKRIGPYIGIMYDPLMRMDLSHWANKPFIGNTKCVLLSYNPSNIEGLEDNNKHGIIDDNKSFNLTQNKTVNAPAVELDWSYT